MEFLQAFPIAIIDEDYEGKNSAGRGMQQLAAAIEKLGFRVVAGITYKDARRIVNSYRPAHAERELYVELSKFSAKIREQFVIAEGAEPIVGHEDAVSRRAWESQAGRWGG